MTDESSEGKAVKSASARARESVPIIGIGASAGGIDALQKFFPAVPPDSGQAFVVVQHLAPDHKSMLADLLARSSRLPVEVVEKETKVEPNHVYVIPPNAILTIKDGKLSLTKPAAPPQHRTPIDSFFVSLAEDQAENAACVILSGTGSDGTLGLRAIKEHGGISFAQTSESAEYDGMMRSAISTGLVDFILPVEEMPAKLIDYFREREKIESGHGNGRIEQEATSHLNQLFALLGTRTGHDFSGYKDKSVIRRVQRRMQLAQMDDVSAYIDRLRKEPRELDLLFQDLLIGVTNFFRDGPAFAALSDEVIGKLFEGKGRGDTVRVWVAGCSTGEEAYSIAILLREKMPKAKGGPNLQIFATDINPHALEVARLGRYPISIAQNVSAERLERHFVREDGTFRVGTDLREICLFSVHNVLRDPPFSKLDLISCRNVMIYLNGDLQNRLVPLFHYALSPNGYLFLGTSENVTRHTRLFATVDKHNRIFRRLSHADRKPIDFPLTPGEPLRGPHAQSGIRPSADASLMGFAEREILARYAPAFVVINAEGEVLQSSPRTGKYLELPSGAPDTNIFSLARKGLGIELRALVRKSVTSGTAAALNNVSVGTNGGRQTLSLMVQPLRAGIDTLYMIVFQDIGGINAEGEHSDPAPEIEGATQHLELELRTIKERLQTTTEELESSNEELKSANEELSSINEELQSSNEELETSKEELQSTNEELHTVNGELSNRVEQLSQANSDIKNLLENTQIATIFLDREFNVQSFTPAANELFRLVESDAGRPITHVRTRFALDTLETDLEKVLRTLGTTERFVRSTDSGALYLARMLPYRTVDNVIGGVVLTFIDITRITAAETRIDELTVDLRNRLENLETLLDLLPIAILIFEDGEAQQARTNAHGMRLLGKENSGKGLKQISEPIRLFRDNQELPFEEQPLQRAARLGDAVESFEGQLLRADGSMLDVLLSALPLLGQDHKPRGAIAALIEISDRKQAERHHKLLINELNHRVKNTLATVQAVASQSLRNAGTMAQAREAFETRLMALSKAHDILTRESWEGVNLREVVAMAANSAENDGRLTSEGPEVRISPKAALALSMAFHELSTNALKYGALSGKSGRVDIAWAINGDVEKPRLTLQWVESGGPIVMPPKRRGFGSRLIEKGLAQDLDGKVCIDFVETGVVCTIDAPLEHAPVAGGGDERQD